MKCVARTQNLELLVIDGWQRPVLFIVKLAIGWHSHPGEETIREEDAEQRRSVEAFSCYVRVVPRSGGGGEVKYKFRGKHEGLCDSTKVTLARRNICLHHAMNNNHAMEGITKRYDYFLPKTRGIPSRWGTLR